MVYAYSAPEPGPAAIEDAAVRKLERYFVG